LVIVLSINLLPMAQTEKINKSRIPFSQRLFWSVFSMFLGFTFCFLLFQFQREKEFAQEKLNNILDNYNYQICQRVHQSKSAKLSVAEFITEIQQKELRVTIIEPSGHVIFDNIHPERLDNHNNREEIKKDQTTIIRAMPYVLPVPQDSNIFIQRPISEGIFIVRLYHTTLM